jgi:hypothetical protein
MDNEQIVYDMDFVEKYKEYEVLINEPEFYVRKLYTIYNTFDILKYMFENNRQEYNIEELSLLYNSVYCKMSREVLMRYESRRLLLINQKANDNYEDNITFLKDLCNKHKQIIDQVKLLPESDSDEEEILIKKKEPETIIEEIKKVEIIPINEGYYSITKILTYSLPTIFINLFIVNILIIYNLRLSK